MSGEGKDCRRSGRRSLLVTAAAGLGAVALARGGSWVLDGVSGSLRFTPVEDPPGFRRLTLIGATSAALDPFAGIGSDGAATMSQTEATRGDLCQDLFGQAPIDPGVVPIAFFSDYNCPNCELLSGDLADIEAASGGKVRVKRHEWPILGQSSDTSARAAIAADRQGARLAFSRRLQGTAFEPTPAYLHELARSAGINADQLFADMQSDEVARELAVSASLVRRFAFPGTPALVVGRTIVVGTIRTATLEALIELERSDGLVPGCG